MHTTFAYTVHTLMKCWTKYCLKGAEEPTTCCGPHRLRPDTRVETSITIQVTLPRRPPV